MDKKIQIYQAQIPDTLDLAHRAELALSGLKGTSDPNDDYLMYFQVMWANNKPYLLHRGCDVECGPKWLDDYQLMRIVSGNEDYREYEDGLHKTLLGFVSMDDGLYYAVYSPKRPWHQNWFADAGYKVEPDDYALLNMGAVETITLITRNDMEGGLEPVVERMCRALVDCAIDKGRYAYYPEDFSTEGEAGRRGGPYTKRRGAEWHTDHDPVEDEHAGPEGSVVAYTGHQVRALAMWAERTRNEEYLDMAGKLTRGMLRPYFWGNPVEPVMVKGAEHGYVDSHFHSRGQCLRGALEYGIVAGDEHVCNFVREYCEYTREFGINQIGWIATSPNFPVEEHGTMEGCYIGDMLAMYDKLSVNGYGDFYDDMDKLIRNTMAEAQFTDSKLLQRVMDNAPYAPPSDLGSNPVSTFPNQVFYSDDIADRVVGNFASYIKPNGTAKSLMQCCSCNAIRGIYYAWDAITRLDGDDAVVNLLLNRASPWLDIDSYLPYEGRVVIKNKTARRISVRIPSYLRLSDVACKLNGADIRTYYAGRFLTIDGLAPGSIIELTFPLRTYDFTYTIYAHTHMEQPFSFTMKANTVLDIDPRDLRPTTYPYYERDHMKADKAPIIDVIRKVSPFAPRY